MIFYWDITQTKDMLTEGQDKIKETLSNICGGLNVVFLLSENC